MQVLIVVLRDGDNLRQAAGNVLGNRDLSLSCVGNLPIQVTTIIANRITSHLSNPVFVHEAGDPAELTHVVGHQGAADSDCMPSNRCVVRSDRCTRRIELAHDLNRRIDRAQVPGDHRVQSPNELVHKK